MSLLEPDKALHSITTSTQEMLPKVEQGCLLDAMAGIIWQGRDCQFQDWRYLPNINLWRDFLPPEIESKITDQVAGTEISHEFLPAELLQGYQKSLIKKVHSKQFQPEQQDKLPISPYIGRFYPKDFFQGIDGIYQGNKFPCRITDIDSDFITVDLNHPLAAKFLNLKFRIQNIKKASAERGGRCNDIPAQLTDYGPGMQDRLADCETDFLHENAFRRLDESDDASFFEPDLLPFWDSSALSVVSSLYDDLLQDDMQILDLMAGAHSPLQQANVRPESITCAGLNRTELEANPICTQQHQINVNHNNALARFDYEQFDAVLIHAAIEYVTRPHQLMDEIARTLKPGGLIVISFSNRSVSPKTVQIWDEIQEFERPGLVLSYLRASNSFTNFNGYSMRGLFRPENDRLAQQLLYSDPVYAIWANKK
jgi:FKBP-type peptidyl-prolyl cis-trans isomerase 2/2-polyprenyl-3-methyl-5-hydroxy-6-metoxy-1,4-benzoquinol methylase